MRTTPIKPKERRGRPPGSKSTKPEYDPEVTPRLAYWMTRSGLTQKQIAKQLGVTQQCVNKWAKMYPDMFDALYKTSKNLVDMQVEDALLKKCLGYDFEEVREEYRQWRNEITNEFQEYLAKRTTTSKHIEPSVAACIFWLQRRQGNLWVNDIDKKPWNAKKDHALPEGQELPDTPDQNKLPQDIQEQIPEEIRDLVMVLSNLNKEEIDFFRSSIITHDNEEQPATLH